MLLKLKRSQKTKIGQLWAGVAYTFDMDNPAHKEVADRLLKKQLAVKTTEKAVAKEAEDLAARQEAERQAGTDGRQAAPAITELMAAKAKEADEAAEKTVEDAKTEAEAIVAAAKVEAEDIVAKAKSGAKGEADNGGGK